MTATPPLWKRTEKHAQKDIAFQVTEPINGLGDGDGPPLTAEQYLLQVRRESQRLPNVVQSKKRPRSPSRPLKPSLLSMIFVPMTDQALLPNPAWVIDFTDQFHRFRSTLSELANSAAFPTPVEQRTPLPHPNNAKLWRQRLLDDNQFPTLSEIVRMDQVSNRAALKHLVELVQADNDGKDIPMSVMVWLWALLMRLDVLLLPDTAAVLRDLFRALATRRSSMAADNDMLGMINISLTIIHRVFGQSIPMNDKR